MSAQHSAQWRYTRGILGDFAQSLAGFASCTSIPDLTGVQWGGMGNGKARDGMRNDGVEWDRKLRPLSVKWEVKTSYS